MFDIKRVRNIAFNTIGIVGLIFSLSIFGYGLLRLGTVEMNRLTIAYSPIVSEQNLMRVLSTEMEHVGISQETNVRLSLACSEEYAGSTTWYGDHYEIHIEGPDFRLGMIRHELSHVVDNLHKGVVQKIEGKRERDDR